MPRVALVTGASRGIGRAVAAKLAATGAPVAVNYRSRDADAAATVELIREQGGRALAVKADVSRTEDVDRCFAEVEEALGPVLVLVNNAGVRSDALAMRMTDEGWRRVIETNLFGPFACSRRALRGMLRARWGRIVNIASVAGLRGSPGQANYAAAKAGVIGLTRTLAREVGAKGITVNAVAPGLVATELTQDLTKEQSDALTATAPVARAGTVEEVARAVAHLCSEDNGYTTGTVITVDGGMTA